MDKAPIDGKTEGAMKACMNMIENMGMASTLGLTDVNTSDNGEMENNMEKVVITKVQMNLLVVASGKMVSVLAG